MKEKLKEQKGITLIALIITIIVMLILAGVSINIIQNQGLITKSKDAADKYNQAAGEEQANLTEWERLMAEYSGSSEEAYVTPRTEVTYKGQTLKVGDYVNYDEGTGYTWTTDASKGTGRDYDWNVKTLTSGTYTTEDMNWRVLGLNAEGNLELISDKQTSIVLYLAGKVGYNNGIEQLNEMCDTLYGKGTNAKSARSVNAEDINAILGYNKRGFKIEEKEDEKNWIKLTYGAKTTYKETTSTGDWFKINGSNEYTREGSQVIFTNIDGTVATDEAPITVESNYYYYKIPELEDKVDSNILEMVFDLENLGCAYNSNSFWLATRCVFATFYDSYWSLFCMNSIYDDNLCNYSLYSSDGDEGVVNRCVRPVVTLKSDVQLSGNSETGWTIQ